MIIVIVKNGNDRDGINACSTCNKKLNLDDNNINNNVDEIGYCSKCLLNQESEINNIIGNHNIDLTKYAESQREEMMDFIHSPDYEIEFFGLNKLWDKLFAIKFNNKNNTIYAILKPDLAASLSYLLIQVVSDMRKITQEESKQFLIRYWKNKYEIDLEDFDHIVQLEFENYSSWNDEPYYSYYDYPDCVFDNFCIRIKK